MAHLPVLFSAYAHPLRRVRGVSLTPEEVQGFSSAGIDSLDSLWLAAAASPGERLAPLSKRTGIDRNRLAEILDQAARAKDSRTPLGWLTQHWLDVVLLLAVVLLVWLADQAWSEAGPKRPTLKPARDIPAFSVLRRQDLLVSPGNSSLARTAVGRVTLSNLRKGVTLDPARLGPIVPEKELADRRVVALTLGARGGNSTAHVGSHIDLMLSPRALNAGSRGAVVEDVLVLAADPQDSLLVAAVPVGRIHTLTDRLATSQVLVLRRLPATRPNRPCRGVPSRLAPG
jgi:hypothetical protein